LSSGSITEPVMGDCTYHKDESCVVSSSTSSSVVASTLNEWAGVNTPGYHKLVKMGALLPITPWVRDEISGKILHGSYQIQTLNVSNPCGRQNVYHTSGVWPGDANAPPWLLTQTDLDTFYDDQNLDFEYLVQAAAGDITSRGFDGLTFLAELHKVRAMFQNAAESLLKLLRDPRYLKQMWLEARYGWRPFIREIIALNEAISKLEAPGPTRYEARKNASSAWSEESDSVIGYSSRTETYTTTDIFSVSARGLCIADITVPPIRFNPLVTGWELIPLSFVVDWFWQVGLWLESLELSARASDKTAGLGLRIEIQRTVKLSNVAFHYAYGTNWTGNMAFEAVSTATRVVRTPKAVPNIPQIKKRPNLSTAKVLDLIAIALQALEGGSFKHVRD